MRRFIALLAAAGVIALAVAASAAADSMVFEKDNNVWISNPDGSGQFQVTLDGTAGAPYETPSEADNGTIVAVRQTPGQRRQIYRMTQAGALLNPPIDTPAPGTGAIDAKVSPDGTLVAYWFVTTVNDPLCAFCVNIANQVLLTHSDRFTGPDEVGNPHTGGWPSWLSNSTITLGSGSSEQWYYTIGMPEAAMWFDDTDITGSQSFNTLLDAEVAPTGDRIAIVRGDSQETIAIVKMTAAPPTKPNVGNCLLSGPTGKFVDPSWQSNGRLLAWSEDDGVWTITVPADVDSCMSYGNPALVVPGGRNPDLSPAAINPGPRPGCGNPGNPVACAGPGPGPGPVIDSAAIRRALGSSAKAGKSTLAKLGIGGLLRKHKFTLSFQASAAGALTAQLTAPGAAAKRATVLASGRHVFKTAGKAKVTVKLTSKGKKRLKHARKLRATLKVSFKPVGASAISSSVSVRMKR